MTRFFSKVFILLTVITIIYCMATGVSLKETIFRAVTVFAGLYAIMVTLFIGLRMILNPKADRGVDAKQR